MANLHYTKKSSISMKQFIVEFGANFSDHMKKKLMELESRSFLMRKEFSNRFDLKHVEHIQYEHISGLEEAVFKEYVYGQFEVNEDVLYFSQSCQENAKVMQSQIVNTIYEALESDGAIFNEGSNLKKVGDNNIDYIIDSTLAVCPKVSQKYLDITEGMVARANNKNRKF